MNNFSHLIIILTTNSTPNLSDTILPYTPNIYTKITITTQIIMAYWKCVMYINYNIHIYILQTNFNPFLTNYFLNFYLVFLSQAKNVTLKSILVTRGK